METQRDPERFLPLTPAAFHILLALAPGERHGYVIMREVERRTVGEVRLGPATLYGTLRRLVQSGLISAVEAGHEGEDERRRYYRLTDMGDAVVRAEALRLAKLVQLAADLLR